MKCVSLFLTMFVSTIPAVASQRYVIVDSFAPSPNIHLSLAHVVDQESPEESLAFLGWAQAVDADPLPITIKVARHLAENLSLPDPEEDETVPLLLDGVPVQTKYGPFVLRYNEERLGDRPAAPVHITAMVGPSGEGLFLSITDDPVPLAIAGVIAGGAVLICGATYLIEIIREEFCIGQAIEQCGEGNVKAVRNNLRLGFSWEGGPEVGCGRDCEIECKED